MKMQASTAELVENLLAGDRRAAAKVITMVENGGDGYQEVMKAVYPHTGSALILGVTGSSGAGKSSLTDQLIGRFRDRGRTVGVVAVDPSSPFSGGAFLGDRIRLHRYTEDPGVYIRSMASRGYLGGLSRATYDVIRILEAMGREVIIVETLGAGQDEVDVIHIAQTCLVVTTPGMGDDIQAMKAGIMEIADVIVVNKADLDGAETCLKHIRTAIGLASFKEDQWVPRVVATVSVAGRPEDIRGIDELMSAIEEHQTHLRATQSLERLRFERIERELDLIFRDRLRDLVLRGLRGTGKKRDFITSINEGLNDPYSVVEEVLNTYIPREE
jgi:LAO/AO transport system kinase